MSYGLVAPMHGQFGFIPVEQSQEYRSGAWTVDRLLHTNGIIAIVIGSLIFLTVFSWVDAFATLFREHVAGPNPNPITQSLLRSPSYQGKSYIKIHHPVHREESNLAAKWRFFYSFILTLVTILITYLLLSIWKHFELH